MGIFPVATEKVCAQNKGKNHSKGDFEYIKNNVSVDRWFFNRDLHPL